MNQTLNALGQERVFPELDRSFRAKVQIEMKVGGLTVKTINQVSELVQALALRYEVFQAEVVGSGTGAGLDFDQFDANADHIAIFNEASGSMIATCRLNSSLFARKFYSEQEFDCQALIAMPEAKLEIGRVCVRREFRKSAVILILWRAIAEYMSKTGSEVLFGCGSVQTQDPREASILYRYLEREGKVRTDKGVRPTDEYRFREFETLLSRDQGSVLTSEETLMAQALLPSLCKSYFDIGCYAAGLPAIDRDFKCIDFLTVLETKVMDPRLRRRMFGG
ncbi:MAG: GNAT family N-acetyltransferase [Oligoflexia bacterium]|nr:GNAT family N-acetyltransferase [Oligoflexia bacterium]